MQLDRSHIVIRERGLAEILDLSLRVIATNGPSLALLWLVGSLPWAVLNHFTLWPLLRQVDAAGQAAEFVALSVLLVFMEMPWALLGVTAYVGQVMFEDDPRRSRVWSQWRQTFASCLWWLGGVRGAIPAWCLAAAAVRTSVVQVPATVLLALLVAASGWSRLRRPFLPEIVILEQPGRQTPRPAEGILARRTQSLHAGYAACGFPRMLAVSALAVLIVVSLYQTLSLLGDSLLSPAGVGGGFPVTQRGDGEQGWDGAADVAAMDVFPWQLAVVWPLSLWLAAGYLAVVRFLSYIDLRVRREGWEVELLLRAARADVPDNGSRRDEAIPEG